jgi:uracil-DNA glycosylase
VTWAPPDPPAPWAHLSFFRDRWPGIAAALAAEPRAVLPPPSALFRALQLTGPKEVRVVILGQDPYPTPGHAMGLAFGVAPGVALPRSLANIYAELQSDVGARPPDGDLTPWARQGVLLLNTCLSVPAGQPGGHAHLGWQALVAEVLTQVSARPTAFLLWGRPAQGLRPLIRGTGHLMIASPHPSPLSARRGFFGSRPFSRVNGWLTARDEAPIRWA